MANESGGSIARFARSLLVKEAAPELVQTEAAGFGISEMPPGPSAEAVEPKLENLIPRKLPDGVSADEVSAVARKVLRSDGLSERETFITEAIIIPDLRPAVFVIDGDYQIHHPAWTDYVSGQPAHANFVRAIPSVGRVELVGDPDIPYGGTGFLVASDLLMTNRHVAEIFGRGLGTRGLRFLDGMGAGVDFLRERNSPPQGSPFAVREIAMIHPYWDLALLRIEGLEGRTPLTLAAMEPDAANPRRIAVVGYPAFDPRNDAKVQDQVFQGVYEVKRLQPGLFNGRRKIESFGKTVNAGTHDSSTLGGNSGSVVIDAETGDVLGLHFAGIYKDSNFAVPACDLARDGRMIDAGLKFSGPTKPAAGPWDSFWSSVEREGTVQTREPDDAAQAPAASAPIAAGATDGRARIIVPLRVDLTVEIAGASIAGDVQGVSGELIEKMVEPIHDPIEVKREGYQPGFIGANVPMPKPRRPKECVALEDGTLEIKYHHFSIVMNKPRRIALFTAANVDGSRSAKEPEGGHRYTRAGLTGLGEGDVEKWYTDPRIRGTEQLPDRFFNKDRKAFDKGHLVRREDVAWGETFAEVQAANGDTYHVTNCSPQVAGFNRSNRRDNWGALEDLVLKQAATERYCLFSGPVLDDDDPDFAGVDDAGAIEVKIPRRFWKVVVANSPEGLKLFAFVLEQDLSATPMEFAVPDSWVPHLVRLSDLEKELGSIDFDASLRKADQYDAVNGSGGARTARVESVVARINAMEPAATESIAESIEGHGRFEGLPAKIALGEDGRSANLLAPLSYFDPGDKDWPVPEGAWLDGASIPQPFWGIIGGPFEGRYREASIVHDHYCIKRTEPWRATHRMFYEGMLCRGVSGFKARVMYYAVYRFGPRWTEPGVEAVAEPAPPAELLTDAKAESILADAEKLASSNLTPNQIEELADTHAGASRRVRSASERENA